MADFDPAQHRMVSEQRWFEDFVLGERFVIPSRTQTSAVFAAFQTASGDTHPIHYDVEYCRTRGMPDLRAWLPAPGPHRAGRRAVSLYRRGIAGRIPRTIEPVSEAGLCRRHPLSRARSDRAGPRPHYRRGDPALDSVQPAQGAGAGRDTEVFDQATACLKASAKEGPPRLRKLLSSLAHPDSFASTQSWREYCHADDRLRSLRYVMHDLQSADDMA
jgi:hypothetical protein